MATRTEREKALVRAKFFSEPRKCQCGCGQVVPREEGSYVPLSRTTQKWMRYACAQKRGMA